MDNKKKINRMIERMKNKKLDIKRSEKKHVNLKNTPSDIKILNNKITEKRDIEILSQCDVLVVGGGPSGISAAIPSVKNRGEYITYRKIWMFRRSNNDCWNGNYWLV